MKLFKNILLASILLFSLFFVGISISFSQECTNDCTVTETVDIPVDNTPVEGFPEPASEPDCGSNFYSQITNKCMKYCDNVNGAYELNESCPAPANNPVTPVTNNSVVPVTPVTGNPATPIIWNNTNPYYNTPPFNPNSNSGVVVTYRPAPVYWGGSNGPAVTYNPAPVYTQPTTVVPVAPRIVCPLNYTVNGQECVPNKKTCNDGSQINFYEPCTKMCWSGSLSGQKIPENQSCPVNNTGPVYNPPVIYNPVTPATNVNNQNKICPGGYEVRVSEQCPNIVNWGGDKGPSQTYGTTTQANTKVCKNGNTVYNYQVCTKSCVDGSIINEDYRCPVAQTVSSVITTNANYITNNSARCNGVADVSGPVNTTGYFEYGTSNSLGKSTNSGNIGYGDNIYYSNTITNLEPNTKYYCRAVIVNKDGAYKGGIVSFVTGANKKVYVSNIIEKEIISTPVKKSSTKKVEVVCKDISGNTDKLEAGEKFLDMRLDNVSGFVSPSEISEYRLEYKNRSTLNLENVLIKIKIPEGMNFVSSTDGVESGDEILIKIGDVKAGESKVINFKLKGDKKLSTGKNIIVQANASYDMLDENGESISDENSIYNISTVTDKVVNINSKVSKETENFWSGWLFKFLLSLLLLIILFILGRNIYKKIMHKRHADRILGHH